MRSAACIIVLLVVFQGAQARRWGSQAVTERGIPRRLGVVPPPPAAPGHTPGSVASWPALIDNTSSNSSLATFNPAWNSPLQARSSRALAADDDDAGSPAPAPAPAPAPSPVGLSRGAVLLDDAGRCILDCIIRRCDEARDLNPACLTSSSRRAECAGGCAEPSPWYDLGCAIDCLAWRCQNEVGYQATVGCLQGESLQFQCREGCAYARPVWLVGPGPTPSR